MMKICCILFLINSLGMAQRADFFREDITFRFNGNYFDVDGYYWFSNPSEEPVQSDIYYPFPNYAGEQIDSIRLFNITAGRNVEYKIEGGKGISFALFIAPNDTALFRIGYRQKLNADSAVYILKTTKGWGKPLKHAEFKLVLPDSLQIKKFSYQPDKEYEIDRYKVYYWKKENFMPGCDMVFHF